MKYLHLVVISIKHSFYDSGNCPDFSVDINPETSRILTGHRCVIKPSTYGLIVYVPVENQTPLISFANNIALYFSLKLKNDQFALYSDQRLKLSDSPGLAVYQAENLINPEQAISTQADANGILLGISIQRDFTQINTTPVVDEISFFGKPLFWIYYLVTNPDKSEKLSIVDFDQKTSWQRIVSLENDSIAQQLGQQYPGTIIVCFISDQALECHESCAKHLQLKLDGQTVIEQLPGPDYKNAFVKTESDNNSKESIYEIVKYFSTQQ